MKKNLIAVYGSLKRGFHNHDLLSGAEFITDLKIAELKMFSLGAFPAVCKSDLCVDFVHVEVYAVDDDTLADLDRLEGHPNWYKRTKLLEVEGMNNLEIYLMPENELLNRPRVLDGNWKFENCI